LKLRIERWKSSENREEIHFFIEGTQTYVFGFNPKLLNKAMVMKWLLDAGFAITFS
jgi:hypothetical protein